MDLLNELNATYDRLHLAKEDAFWASLMGLGDDPDANRAAQQRTEIAWSRFLQDPERLRAARAALAGAEASGDEDAAYSLRGWVDALQAHAIDSAEGQELSEAIVAAEGALAGARGSMNLGYEHPQRGFLPANSIELGNLVRTSEDPAIRQAAWRGLRSIEDHVLANGFVELVRQRNKLGRMLGGEDFYDWQCTRVERMSKAQIFELLDELEVLTRPAGDAWRARVTARHGAEALQPWNASFLTTGDSVRERDPYFPFAEALDRWGRSFAALGVDYRGADVVVDLVQRKGKYENGFMHGPVPAWRQGERLRPARIQFTANALPGQVGSGYRAMTTLFHEGGHAAHFANIDQPAPIFAQEFAPTSAAFAELQSMFLDSFLDDPAWQVRYARDRDGQPMPPDVLTRGVRATAEADALGVRAMLTVCLAERAIYEIPDEELSAETILAAIRRVEARVLGMAEGSPRPVLSVPHLLSGESSAYYHAYVLAEMAVEQTRAFFAERDGAIVDNPRVGPDLAEAYWRPGNSRGFPDLVAALTGAPPSPRALAERVNRSPEAAVAEAEQALSDPKDGYAGSVELGFGSLRVAHGDLVVGSVGSGGDFSALSATFAAWVDELAG